MTISVESNGLEFTFPDGTTTAQISESLGEYFRANPPQAKSQHGWLGDMGEGLARGAVQQLERWGADIFAPSVPDNVREAVKAGGDLSGVKWDSSATPWADAMPAPQTTAGKVAEAAPEFAASLVGYGKGAGAVAPMAEALSEKLGGKALGWVADKLVKGAGGTIGGAMATGESATPEQVAEGAAVNLAMEGLFHTPQALKLIKPLLAKNGSEIQAAADYIGVNPSMGVTSGRSWIRTLENLIQKVPGGNLLNLQNAKSLATMDSFIQGIKSKLGYQGDASALGREIRAAIESAQESAKAENELAYDALVKSMPKGQRTNTRRFTRLVESMNGVNPREGIHEMTVPPVARRYFDLLEKAGKIPQESGYSNVVMSMDEARKALKILDDYIGTGANADADTAAAKRMAKALREDITGTFDALGLGGRWRAANEKYAANMALLNEARSVLGRAETGDAIYTRLFGNEAGAFSAKGADTLAPLKAVMTPDEWNHIAAEVVHRLGQESAGMASAEGRKFNPSIFLTNWNKLNPAARELLFDVDHEQALTHLAKLSKGFKDLDRDANHSNTAHHVAAMSMAAAVASPAHWLPLLATIGTANIGARLLINPKATRLLVDAAYAVEPNQVQKWIIAAAALAASNPELQDDIAALGGDKN